MPVIQSFCSSSAYVWVQQTLVLMLCWWRLWYTLSHVWCSSQIVVWFWALHCFPAYIIANLPELDELSQKDIWPSCLATNRESQKSWNSDSKDYQGDSLHNLSIARYIFFQLLLMKNSLIVQPVCLTAEILSKNGHSWVSWIECYRFSTSSFFALTTSLSLQRLKVQIFHFLFQTQLFINISVQHMHKTNWFMSCLNIDI